MSFALIRSKGPVAGDGRILTKKQLRDAIPAGPLLALQIDAAFTGRIKCIDTATGEEVGIAFPIPIPERLKLIQTLVDKRLPAAKTMELDDDGHADLSELSLDPEEVKRLPLSQLSRVLEAQFEVNHEPSLETSGPRTAAPIPDAGGSGADRPGDVAGETDHPNGDGE